MRQFFITGLLLITTAAFAQKNPAGSIVVKRATDFAITGTGGNEQWNKASWVSMPLLLGADERLTKFKTLYSDSGIYFLFHSQDAAITSTMTADFDSLWTQDVVEVFLWPDTTQTVYFEYELSPTNHELPILIPNLKGKFLGWRPWLYSGNRKTRHLTSIQTDPDATANIKSWTGEFFIPWTLLAPLNNVPPRSGSRWRSNMYRVDYDDAKTIEWSWKKVSGSFHQFRKFGTLVFE